MKSIFLRFYVSFWFIWLSRVSGFKFTTISERRLGKLKEKTTAQIVVLSIAIIEAVLQK